jgi:hypothetical protein
MACCAFAVYLLAQLLWPLRRLRDHLFGAPGISANAVVGWSPSMTAFSTPKRSRLRRGVVLVVLLEAAGLGAVVTAAVAAPAARPPVGTEAQLMTALHSSICSDFGKSLP